MKNFVITMTVLFASAITMQAQEFQGMATYESKSSTAELQKSISGNKEITPEMQAFIAAQMRRVFEKTFVLNFDKSASIYKEEEKLEAPGQQQNAMRMMNSVMGGGGTHYKNIKDQQFSVDREFMGKEFLVVDSLPKLEWKLGSESKKIGEYTCFKATAVKPVSKTDFRNFRPRKDSEDKDAKAESTAKTNLMDNYDMPEEVEITAWYTPEIPVSQGPENYWGLPGLILEVSDGKTVILCSKIVINPKDKATIKAPTKGKVVTQKEYDKIVLEKMEEMKQMNGGRNMRIGG